MYIIGSIFVIIVGLIMLISPNTVYELKESWKSYSASDPSDLYLITTRIGGGIFTLVGIVCLIILIINP